MGKYVAVTIGWWPRSISDGDCHYGEMAEGTVRALGCGEVFAPDVNPYVGRAVRQTHPADPQHACPACARYAAEHGVGVEDA